MYQIAVATAKILGNFWKIFSSVKIQIIKPDKKRTTSNTTFVHAFCLPTSRNKFNKLLKNFVRRFFRVTKYQTFESFSDSL